MRLLGVLNAAKYKRERPLRIPVAYFHYCSTKIVSAHSNVASHDAIVLDGWSKSITALAILISFAANGTTRLRSKNCERSGGECSPSNMSASEAIDAYPRRSKRSFRGAEHIGLLTMVGALAGCANAPLVQGVGLSSYDSMTPSDGLITKSRMHVKKEQVLAAKTVKIVPTTFPDSVAPKLTNQQRKLVANAADRALCVSLSDRFKVVTADQAADLIVRASVTQATETNEVAAGISAATSIGMNFVDVGVPVPTPRIPIGMGNLSVEAEATDPSGRQQAAMLWARGANALFSSARVSKASDAYDLADSFGEDFGSLLVKGESPFGNSKIELPALHKIGSTVGLAPKQTACENYGRYPGIAGFVGGQLGLPPEWTDKGAKQVPK
ncbi:MULTISPECIES: DUF3313 domain-containing protein [unclassified Chelatococcus]|uniref:DUF3313 domain-containing protein n=1 Tax=unclassified Chelatococcus TaxID=2638111 RepID=UPI0020BFC4F0|nr:MULTISPECIES: DUF3313 domain-containing protein [unclassified Chelatococcus]MCO5075688.1 DUF3313 domain-containing protein [Chelatococcus sp.]CAH1654414.1 conserved hypothetical protein [Hyphomicrobiales bacterium]CAH1694900.1 conserved hypothetical protein [Hyphomicrobiales bacterium]